MRRHVLSLMRRGLVTLAEAALIAHTDRKTVWRWCRAGKVNPATARASRVAAYMAAAERITAGRGVRDEAQAERHPRTGPSKAQLQRQADKANACFRSRSKKIADPC